MKEFDHKGGIARRRFLAGSIGLAAIGLVSPLLGTAASGVSGVSGAFAPRSWLGRIDIDSESGARIRPAGFAASNLRSDQPLMLRVRGPWPLAVDAPMPRISLGMVYRSSPQHPFSLWKHSASAEPISVRLHSHASALAGVEVRCDNGVDRCALTGLSNPALDAGRYVVVIDPSGRHTGPDWAALDFDAQRDQVISHVSEPALAALLLDVSTA